MFVIGNIPKPLKNFFGNLSRFFEKRQWPHFWSLVLAFTIAHGRRNISHMNLFLEDRRLRQRRQDFLVLSPWNHQEVLQTNARSILNSMKPQKGELLEVIGDLTHAAKRGKTMEGAHRYFDHVTKSYRFGHDFVTTTLRFRGVTIPWSITLWLPTAFCHSEDGKALGLKFKTSNQILADIIRQFPEDFAKFFRIRVLFDSAFLNKLVVGACRERGFSFISVSKLNRVFFPFTGGKRKIASYGPGVLRKYGKDIHIPGRKGKAKFRVAARAGTMRGIGDVRVVFSRRLSDGSFIALVTDDMDLKAVDVILGYRERWPIEVMLKNLKQYLGLGDYQTTKYEGIIHHLHLCLISFQVLTVLAIQGSKKKRTEGSAIESIQRLQERLRTIMTKDQIARLKRAKNPVRALSNLKDLLVAA